MVFRMVYVDLTSDDIHRPSGTLGWVTRAVPPLAMIAMARGGAARVTQRYCTVIVWVSYGYGYTRGSGRVWVEIFGAGRVRVRVASSATGTGRVAEMVDPHSPNAGPDVIVQFGTTHSSHSGDSWCVASSPCYSNAEKCGLSWLILYDFVIFTLYLSQTWCWSKHFSNWLNLHWNVIQVFSE